MSECICVNCPNKCYEWTYKEDKCIAESEVQNAHSD